MATLAHPRLSPQEFATLMERAGWRAPIELIEGEVVVIPPTGGDASFAQIELAHRLRAWQGSQASGGRVLTDVFVRIGDGYLAPDVAFWAAGREPQITPGAITTVPDLVVDVLSPSTRGNDLGPKRREYLAAGVAELWLVDPSTRSVTVITPGGERTLDAAATLGSELLPGFAMPVRDALA